MIPRFARSYVQALLRSAGSTEAGAEIRGQLQGLVDVMGEVPAIAKMAANPAVPIEVKERIVRELARRGGFNDLAKNFVLLLTRNFRLQHLPSIVESLDLAIKRQQGISVAQVTVAHVLDDAQTERLTQALAKAVGGRVEVDFSVDESLMAGFRAKVGSTVYDGSLNGQLERLTRRLANA